MDNTAQGLPQRIENIVNGLNADSASSDASEDSIARDNDEDYSDSSDEAENEHDYLKPLPALAQHNRITAQQVGGFL